MASMSSKKKKRTRRGAAILEVAIALPLLLIVTTGIIEYGWPFKKLSHATNAARAGARVGARADGTLAQVNTTIQNAMALGNMQLNTHYTTPGLSNPALLTPGASYTVTVRINYAAVGLHMPLIPVPANIDAKMVMAREGP